MSTSKYEPGTQLSDHFEVVEKTSNEIVIRCGDSPRNEGPRDSDGLLILGANIDKARGEAVLELKCCFFDSSRKVEGIHGPVPIWSEVLHRWYSRVLMAAGSLSVTR